MLAASFFDYFCPLRPALPPSKKELLRLHREGLQRGLQVAGALFEQYKPWEQRLVRSHGADLEALLEELAADPTVEV